MLKYHMAASPVVEQASAVLPGERTKVERETAGFWHILGECLDGLNKVGTVPGDLAGNRTRQLIASCYATGHAREPVTGRP